MAQKRPVSLLKALRRGFGMSCPQCGEGRLFRRYLKTVDYCPVCDEELFHHEADDYPAYLVVFLVGKAVFVGILAVELLYRPPYWVHFAIWLPLTMVAVLALLQPIKGAVVALQWSLGLHGFEEGASARAGSK